MLNDYTLYYARSIVSIVLLSISSFQDFKKREIDDRIWIVFAAAALFINLVGALEGFVDPLGWVLFAVLQSLFFIGLYYIGAFVGTFGGADAKSLICLSIMYPASMTGFMLDLSMGRLTEPLSTLNNALVLSLVFPFFNLFWNISMRLKGVELFKGLEKESFHRRLIALFLLMKVRFSHYRSNSSKFTLAEKYSRSGIRRIVFIRPQEGNFSRGFKDDDYVFTSFLIPLQVFIMLGLAVRLLYGDILLQLAIILVTILRR
ncbi:MAG: A24 family peptidase [Nitrososphaerota archaeon]|nr:A24 family peptidase [Nitrososphaerota archaeon]